MKIISFVAVLLTFLATDLRAQRVTTIEQSRDQVATSRGFLIAGALLCIVPVVAITDGDQVNGPKNGLFMVGCAAIVTGTILNLVGKRNEKRLNLTPGHISYKF